MSLLIDLLKKVNKKGERNKSGVYPGLEKDSDTSKKRSLTPYLIVIFIVITALAGGFIYYLNSINNENVIVYNRKPPIKKVHISQETPKKTIKTALKTLEEKTNFQKLNKLSKEEKIKKINEKVENKNLSPKIPPPIIKEKKTVKPQQKSVKAKEKIPDINRLLNQVNYYQQIGEYQKALDLYRNILKYKQDKDIINNFLILSVRTGNTNNLYKYISYVDNKIAVNIMLELIKLNKIDEGFKFLNHLKNRGKKAYLASGILYEASGYLKEAFNFYKKAYELNPFDEKTGYYYARILEINGDYEHALKIYKKTVIFIKDKNLKKIIENRINFLSKIVE